MKLSSLHRRSLVLIFYIFACNTSTSFVRLTKEVENFTITNDTFVVNQCTFMCICLNAQTTATTNGVDGGNWQLHKMFKFVFRYTDATKNHQSYPLFDSICYFCFNQFRWVAFYLHQFRYHFVVYRSLNCK